jgi:hypothetical protein
MKTKTFHQLLQPTSRDTFLRAAIHCSPRQPRQNSPLSSTIPDIGCPRPLHCSLANVCNVRGSKTTELRFRFDTIELTLPPPPPCGGHEPHAWRRQLVSDEVNRESDVRFRFSGVSSLRGWQVKRCGQRWQVAKRSSPAHTGTTVTHRIQSRRATVTTFSRRCSR